MNETDYNARLYEKMKAEQDKYRDWLLHQESSEILNHTYECHKAKQRTLFDNFQFVRISGYLWENCGPGTPGPYGCTQHKKALLSI